MISMIAAVADDGAIGKNNALPWHISGDLKYFKKMTKGHRIIMGRRTFESFPGVLPHREHYVLTRDPEWKVDHERVHICHDAKALLSMAKESEEEWFVIGGSSVYAMAMDTADQLLITRVHTTVDQADAWFPGINSDVWTVASKSETMVDQDSGLEYEFVRYERVK